MLAIVLARSGIFWESDTGISSFSAQWNFIPQFVQYNTALDLMEASFKP